MSRPFPLVTAATALCLLLAAAAPAALAATHRIPKVAGEARTDGRLDEPFWGEALRLELGYEVRPGENIQAPVRTEVYLAHSDRESLAAVVAHDPRPKEIRARVCDRDQIAGDDWVALVLDTFNDNRRGIELFVNPLGVQADAVMTASGDDATWDIIWDSAGRITGTGYVVEYRVPFSSLRFQRSERDQTWGLDVVRSYPRGVDHRLALFPRDRSNNCYLCQSDEIVGFAGVQPGHSVEIAPTFAATVRHERESFPDGDFTLADEAYEPGVTARWGFTPNLTAAATLNPDFSQVEADAVQLDINRQYALYYPEARPFFVEDAELFSAGLQAVHTRTLADPRWGVKLTGKEGPHAIGFFSVRDDVTNLLFPGPQGSRETSLEAPCQGTVLRYRRDVGRGSTLGLLVTDREGENGYWNRTASLTGRVLATPRDLVRLQFMGSHTRYPGAVADAFNQPRATVKGNACELLYEHETRDLVWYGLYKQVDSGLRADLGYMVQAGYRNGEVGAERIWTRDSGHWWNRIEAGAAWETWRRLGGPTLDEAWSAWLECEGLGQSSLEARLYHDYSHYEGRDYELTFLNFEASASPSGRWNVAVEGMVGDGLDYEGNREGRQLSLAPQVDLRLGRHLQATLRHLFERLSLDAGRLFTANATELRLVYQFDRRAFLRAILQRSDYERNAALYAAVDEPRSRSLFNQLLFSYTVNPQTVLYLGYSDNYRGNQDVPLTSADRTLFAKVGYAWMP